mgnify:CR=1 FL=1
MAYRPVILLAAHGERGGASKNERLAQITEAVGKSIPEADVGSVLVNVEGAVERTLAACGERPVLCLPLLFSDGYFYEQRLRPSFGGKSHRLAAPLALWRSFAPFLADNLALRLISQSADPRVVIARSEPPYSCIGLFLGEGLHGGEDFDVLVSSAKTPPIAAFTAGELPGLPCLIADEARARLADQLRS